jgi:hypothetical protein
MKIKAFLDSKKVTFTEVSRITSVGSLFKKNRALTELLNTCSQGGFLTNSTQALATRWLKTSIWISQLSLSMESGALEWISQTTAMISFTLTHLKRSKLTILGTLTEKFKVIPMEMSLNSMIFSKITTLTKAFKRMTHLILALTCQCGRIKISLESILTWHMPAL